MQLIKHLAKEKVKKEKEKEKTCRSILKKKKKKEKKPTNLHNICRFQLAQLVKFLMVV